MVFAIAFVTNYNALKDCNFRTFRAIRFAFSLALRGLVLVEEKAR